MKLNKDVMTVCFGSLAVWGVLSCGVMLLNNTKKQEEVIVEEEKEEDPLSIAAEEKLKICLEQIKNKDNESFYSKACPEFLLYLPDCNDKCKKRALRMIKSGLRTQFYK